MRTIAVGITILLLCAGALADSQWYPPVSTSVFFPSGSSNVPVNSPSWASSQEALLLAKAVDADVVVIARADAFAHDGQALAQARGEAIKAALVVFGITAERIQIRAIGATKPIVETPTGREEPQNRIVQLYVQTWRRRVPEAGEFLRLSWSVMAWFEQVCEAQRGGGTCNSARPVYGLR